MKHFVIAKICLIINIIVIVLILKSNNYNIFNITFLELALSLIMFIAAILNIKTMIKNIDPFYDTREDNEKIGGF